MNQNVLPVTVKIGDELEAQTTMKMQIEIDVNQFSQTEMRVTGDAMFKTISEGDVPGFLRLLADKIEEKTRAGNVRLIDEEKYP